MTPPEEVGYAHSMPNPAYRTAIVTGASRGIGAATVHRLRRQGLAVHAVARSAEPLKALAEETGCLPLPIDIAAWIGNHKAELPSGADAEHSEPKLAALWGTKR